MTYKLSVCLWLGNDHHSSLCLQRLPQNQSFVTMLYVWSYFNICLIDKPFPFKTSVAMADIVRVGTECYV